MSCRCKLICGLFILFNAIASSSTSQSLADEMKTARNIEKFTESEQVKNLIALSEKPYFQIHSDTLGLLFYYITFRCYNIEDKDQTILFAGKAIEAFEDAGYEGYQLAKSYLLRAYTHHLLENNLNALDDLDKIINKLSISGRAFISLWRAVQKRAAIFRSNGEYESSIHFINTFIQSERFNLIDEVGKATIYRELSIAHSMYGSRERLLKAKLVNAQATKICDSLNHSKKEQLEQVILNIMHEGLIEWHLDEKQSAINQYNQALKLMEGKPDYYYINRLTTNCLINIARLNVELDSCSNALKYIRKARDLHIDKSQQNFKELESGIGSVSGTYHLCRGEYDIALSELNSTKEFLLNDSEIYSITNLRNYQHKELLINNLSLELKVLFEHSNQLQQNRFAQLENKALQLDSLINYYLEDMYFNESKIELKSELDEFYKLALDISFDSNDLEKFWYYSEKRSNLLILKNDKEDSNNDSTFNDLESSLSSLKREVSHIENQIYKLDGKNKIKQDSLNNRLVSVNAEQLKLLEKRSKSEALNSKNITTLSEFTNDLDANKTLLSYQFGVKNLYALKVDINNTKLFDLGPSSLIKEKVQNWFSTVSKRRDNNVSLMTLDSDSEFLFENLVSPLGQLLTDVVIIPNEELYYLSFDALKSGDGKYLIEEYNISYDLSGTLANHHKVESKNTVKNISIFLPSYEDSEYSNLEHASQDYSSLVDINGISIFEKDQTTKPNFISSLEEADIVHFGGHAIHVDENNQYSHLAMVTSDQATTNMVTLGDLYSLDVNSKLVSLPACNTGMGSLLQGEGISNLTRGFFYGGAETVISSLWDVDDKSTSIIMNNFYENLKDGFSKSEAMRRSKLSYLNSVPDFLRHPNLWSGLILTGSDNSMSFKSTNITLILVFIFLLLLLILGIRFINFQ